MENNNDEGNNGYTDNMAEVNEPKNRRKVMLQVANVLGFIFAMFFNYIATKLGPKTLAE